MKVYTLFSCFDFKVTNTANTTNTHGCMQNIITSVIKKIENFKRGTGIAGKTYKTRRDLWGGNVNHKSLF